jgi:serine/threonine protein kinase/tetratricopeptide (TPR) repeat protein
MPTHGKIQLSQANTGFAVRLQEGMRGRYAIERELGEGGMAVVFLAKDERHDRYVALKVLRPELASEIGAERFLREIKIAAGLTHPHILPLFDSGEAGDFLFYVMPNMEGKSLRERLDSDGQLPLEDALRITQEVASALDYAHRHGVVHRDIKPENILLHEGAALVADFGIGKAASSAGGSITQTGIAVGTPAYMSPEQSTAEQEIDGRSDLYSLGCVLYEMLTGEQPYTGPTAQAVIAKRFISPVPHVNVVRDVPDEIDRAITRALSRMPVDRYSTSAEFAAALRQVQGGASTPPGIPSVDKSAPDKKSIAVLPLANRSADPENEYFSDGMTEEIINVLGKVPGIQVASRTSSFAFKGRDVDVREIGEKLGVGSVLEGSVRKVGNRIRITAQLTDVTNGYNLWNETYDRQLEDVFAVQDEISRAIVEALKVQLVGDTKSLVVPTTENLEAYNLYLKGRFFYYRFTENDLKRGIDFFEQALAKDPKYAKAHAGIADCWSFLADDWVVPDEAYPKAKAAAMRALDLEQSLSEAFTALGRVLAWYEWDFPGAERELARAVKLNPNSAEAHFVNGSTLPCVGRLQDAIAEMRAALVLDPLSPLYSRWLGRYLLFSGDWDGALDQSRKTLEIDTNYYHAFLDIGAAYLGKGDPERALEWYRRAQSLESSVRSYDAHLVRVLAVLGQSEEAHAIMERLEQESQERYMRAEVLAMGYAALGESDRAFDCLDEALNARSAGLIFVHLDPGYEPLRSDPRLGEIARKIGVR